MILENYYSDPDARAKLLRILADSIRFAHARSPASWSVSLHGRGERVNVIAGRIFVFQFRQEQVSLTLVDDELPADVLDRIFNAAVRSGRGDFKSLPGGSWYTFPPEKLLDLWPDIEQAHRVAIEKAVEKTPNTPYRRGFSEEAVRSLEGALELPLPRPSYAGFRISDRLINQLRALVELTFPGWKGFQDPRFVEGEIQYKRDAAAKAAEQLSKKALESLIEAEAWSEVIERVRQVGQATNLMWLSVPKSGDMAIVHDDDLDPAAFSRAFFDLLHGEGDSPERLGRYAGWVEGSGLPSRVNKWTFPTYFLFFTNPAEDFFVKPEITRQFIRAARLDLTLPPYPDPAAYAMLRDAVTELREALAEHGAQDMIDVQSLLWHALRARLRQVESCREAVEDLGPGVREAFEGFREEPEVRFIHELKRRRVRDLQELLFRPDKVTLEVFDEEVWTLETRTVLDGEDVTGRLEVLAQEDSERLRHALAEGRLELHGNYLWGSGTNRYGTMLSGRPADGSVPDELVRVFEAEDVALAPDEIATRISASGAGSEEAATAEGVERVLSRNRAFFEIDGSGRYRLLTPDEQRLRNVRAALEVLNDTTLEPIEKAREIQEIPGFGRNTATGLAMVFHPDEFAIYNKRSQGALEKLGLNAAELETFQACVSLLKDDLGAADFLELDHFLWKLDKGEIPIPKTGRLWWVNQGATFKQEREGGYVWAPRAGEEGRGFQHHENVARLRPRDHILHYAKGALRAVGRVLTEAEKSREPGKDEDTPGRLARIDYEDLPEPIPLDDIPLEWRKAASGPFHRKGGVNQGYLYPISEDFAGKLVGRFPILRELGFAAAVPIEDGYVEPPFPEIEKAIQRSGMKIEEDLLRRYHLALKTRGFVILSGISGTGKTWLTELYAKAVGARYRLVPVAPNWTSNEDLLGYYNPLDRSYYDTEFSRFLREAADAWREAESAGLEPRPYHLALDEMNLARVEYYFARFLSAMEIRARQGVAEIGLGPDDTVVLPPNLFFVGTVNIDETTHGFADKIFDRAQVVELEAPEELLRAHLGEAVYRDAVMDVWRLTRELAPFAFRVMDEISSYVEQAESLGVTWEQAVDEQIHQKVLPKLKGADHRLEGVLLELVEYSGDRLPLTREKAKIMLEALKQHGFASYF